MEYFGQQFILTLGNYWHSQERVDHTGSVVSILRKVSDLEHEQFSDEQARMVFRGYDPSWEYIVEAPDGYKFFVGRRELWPISEM